MQEPKKPQRLSEKEDTISFHPIESSITNELTVDVKQQSKNRKGVNHIEYYHHV